MDIISLPIDIDAKKYHGRFGLVNIAAQRAKDLIAGAAPKRRSLAPLSKKLSRIKSIS
jgi:DNA-directed RNA polymerase subunit K/omega